MYQTFNLSHNEALSLVDSVRANAEKAGEAVCVAVCDSHGELLAFLRMDGCPVSSVYVAQNKAFTAARERTASGTLGKNILDSGHPMTNFGSLRYTTWPGGLPILYAGTTIGGIGVSGLTGEEDAQLADKAIKGMSKE
jgi:glc operon protein GlcG